MSWQNITIAVVITAVVGLYIYKHFAARLSEVELTEIKKTLASGARLVDVRTPQEFAAGHIDGAINIPVSDLPGKLKRLGQKNQSLVVYCRSGSRSGHAVSFLKGQGFKHVLDLKAMSNWRALQSVAMGTN